MVLFESSLILYGHPGCCKEGPLDCQQSDLIAKMKDKNTNLWWVFVDALMELLDK
jgi:hypothetical protein